MPLLLSPWLHIFNNTAEWFLTIILTLRQSHTFFNFYEYSFFSLAIVQWNKLRADVILLPALTQFFVAVRSFDDQLPYIQQACF